MSLRNRQDYDASFKVLNKESSGDESTGDYHSLAPTETTQVGQQSEVCTQSRHFFVGRPSCVFVLFQCDLFICVFLTLRLKM